MGDPTRLLSAQSDAEALERALLESLQDVEAPEAAKAAMWGQLATQLAVITAAGAGAAVGTSAAASAGVSTAPAPLLGATKLVGSAAVGSGAAAHGVASSLGGGLAALVPKTLLAKVLVVGALSGAGGTAVWLQRTPAVRLATTQTRQDQAASAARSHAPVPRERTSALAELVPSVEPPVAPSIELPGARAPTAHKQRPRDDRTRDALARESRMLTDARAALRTGDLALARRMLKRLTTDFAHGELLQEREVLQIELLSARGEDEAAARQARRFMGAHPDSPHSAQLARFLR